jgi:Holliday junction resolvase RusA-like endonuclease
MKHTFIIPGRLPSLNEYIAACNRAWFIGQGFKNKQMRTISVCVIAGGVPVFTKPVTVLFRWFEKDKRRDRDNIRSAEKYVMDALKHMHRIKNDNQKWVLDSKHEILLDKQNPRVEVTLTEVSGKEWK